MLIEMDGGKFLITGTHWTGCACATGRSHTAMEKFIVARRPGKSLRAPLPRDRLVAGVREVRKNKNGKLPDGLQLDLDEPPRR